METKKGNASLEDIIKEIGSLSDVKKLPPYVQELLKKNLESVSKIKLPIFTFKENNEWIAKTPLLDIPVKTDDVFSDARQNSSAAAQ